MLYRNDAKMQMQYNTDLEFVWQTRAGAGE